MFLLKDRLEMHFEKRGWKFKDQINPSTMEFGFKITQNDTTFYVKIDTSEMDRILASETYLKYWVENVDMHYSKLISLGGNR